jgi:hypothetical protein
MPGKFAALTFWRYFDASVQGRINTNLVWRCNMDDPLSNTQFPAAKRSVNRDSLLLTAILRFPNTQEELPVRIRNLSAGGLMAELPTGPMRGELVEVNLHNIGWVSGRIAWVSEGRVGIAFENPINPKDARKPVAVAELDIPPYLKKLNATTVPGKLRRA